MNKIALVKPGDAVPATNPVMLADKSEQTPAPATNPAMLQEKRESPEGRPGPVKVTPAPATDPVMSREKLESPEGRPGPADVRSAPAIDTVMSPEKRESPEGRPGPADVRSAPATDPVMLREKAESPERPGRGRVEASPPPTDTPEKPAAPPPPPPKRKAGRRLVLLVAGLLAATAASWFGYHWWTTGRFIVSTDDAYVGADFTAISPRISGYVTEVEAETNKTVKAGAPLVTLDDSDERLAVTAAETQIASQTAAIDRIDRQIEAARTAVVQAQATISSAEADLDLAAADLKRAQRLKQSDFVSAQALEQANATQEKAQASLDTAKAGLTSAEANVAVLAAQRVEAERALDQDRNTLARRKLDLERTVIRAPFDGVIGNRNVQAGQYVSPGQRLLALVPLSKVYVDANYKETQLAGIHVGAPAEIAVDAYDDKPVTGIVESIAPASGAVFSLLPPDNATGNFTKVTQRLAVRIAIPADVAAESLLRPGMSVVVSIDSRAQTNPAKIADFGDKDLLQQSDSQQKLAQHQ